MKTNTSRTAWIVMAVATLALAACARQMEPAKAALAGIESTIAAVAMDAGKYVPEQLASTQAKLAELQSAFDKKDYAAVITGAPAVLADAQGLAAAASAKKDEMMKMLSGEWTNLTAAVPALVTSVQSRLTVLGKSRTPPKDVDMAGARSMLADASAMWAQAQAAATSGNVEDAVATAKKVKEKAEAAAAALKMKLPGS
jgi:hypothetical protein